MLDFAEENPWYYTMGTSFPPYPRLHEQCFRTDIRGGMMFRWSGTYWLSELQFVQDASREEGISATAQIERVPVPQDLDIFLIRVDSAYYFTVNDATVQWEIDVKYVNSGGTGTVIQTDNTWSRAPGTGWKKWSDPYAVLVSGAMAWEPFAVLRGGASTIYGGMTLTYKLRAT